MLQTSHLYTFREVIACGSFAKAGARLGLTASAVSQQVAGLERDLGVRLFDRGARTIRPTAAAATLVLRVDSALVQLDILEREANAMAAGTRGTIRIGSFPTASARLLPGALARLSARRSGIDVLLDEGEPHELLSRLESGSLDIAVVYRYDALPTAWPSKTQEVGLLHESLVLLAGKNQAPPPKRLVDTAESSWVASREDTAGARCLERLCGDAGFAPRVAYRSNDYDVVRGLVAADLGVAVIPALAHADDATTLAVVVSEHGAGRTVSVLHRNDDENPLLPMVIDALRQAAKTLRSETIKSL